MIRMVLGSEELAMASETHATIKCDLLFRRGRPMRIVAAPTRHGVARLLLALALRKGLYLADGAKSRTRSVDEEEVPNVVGERVAGLEFVSMTSWAFNRR